LENHNFTSPHSLKTAVLFLIFNRIDTTKQVFEEIRKAKPPRLYIAADGPRDGKVEEEVKVKSVREYVMSHIDWNCKVKTLFREKNLSCKYAVTDAITWFFENEEMGIILEDDCLPSQSFFWFCEELLKRYKDDERIMMIAGLNYCTELTQNIDTAYLFSRYFAIWGWATWRRAWHGYDVEMRSYDITAERNLRYMAPNYLSFLYYKIMFDDFKNNMINSWCTQWTYFCMMNSGLCIVPYINFITNIGVEGTHTNGKATENNFIKRYELSLDKLTTMPQFTVVNCEYDKKLFKSRIYKMVIIHIFCDFLKRIKLYNIIRAIKNAVK